ncbi:hypothetical protein NEHOM01_1630 [Nematocida homosporus]|uniref:uncharacterized protein n=1 Tax=Nematocida homosporus TaxID=1912981 RepID=UPI00221EA5A8|nr:uncharacterized protein NEHOM01_1630 [Nematocida homosporus]KAI5186677.1 hypothetical protein NEHOM01_1630 [Nematocida homosporus]
MHFEWLQKAFAPLGVEIGTKEEVLHGVLVGTKGRKEWRFTANLEISIADLCYELQRQMKVNQVTANVSASGTKLVDAEDGLHLIVDGKHVLFVERESVCLPVYPLNGEREETGSRQGIILKRVGTKQRVCDICKSNVSVYKKRYDIMLPPTVKLLCAPCYHEFHWTKSGEQIYTGFVYDMNN